jgi:uncharacterized small protein (DUF1192 family)
MLFDDDLDPKTKKKALKPLDKLSIDELGDYIISLKEEIIRVETEVARKKAHKDAMSGLFKT